MTTLETKINQLKGVSKTLISRLRKLEIETVRDLIFYYPYRYDDFSLFLPIKKLEPGITVTIKGRLELLANRRTSRKRAMLTEGLVSDETGSVKILWFNQPWISSSLRQGEEYYFSGKVVGDMFDLHFNGPEYKRADLATGNQASIVPVYSLTQGITSKQINLLVKSVLEVIDKIEDEVPEKVFAGEKFPSFNSAVKEIHFPKDKNSLASARRRLAFDELFPLQVRSRLLRKKLEQATAYKINFFQEETKNFVNGLKFNLTGDQKKSAWEILKNMQADQPMNRLLEGDVGSGKTLVAALAMYNVALNKFQSAIMAPTEILAHQHFKTIKKFFGSSGVRIGLNTSAQKIIDDHEVDRAEFLKACSSGKIDIIVGTHALISEDLKFKNLALAVVDEQHRFGVEQRKILKEKSKNHPHFLSLTATPIPRSLALTVYGDLDISIIKEMPAGRKKIVTKIVESNKRHLAYQFIAEQIKKGRQAFVICPLIDPSDKLGVRSAKEEFERLEKEVFSEFKIGLMHGRLKSKEKEEVIKDFSDGKIKLLVSTSVVEVGIDVPNATVMMIEGAERFGLAQIHQFRGRVGRGEHQSYCFLFSDSMDPDALTRLQPLVETQDGFVLAQRDLEQRGAGAVYGYQQSGMAGFYLKIADLKDIELIKKVREAAEKFVEENDLKDYPLLKKKVDNLDFSDHLE